MSMDIPKNFQKVGGVHMYQAKVGSKQLAVGKKICRQMVSKIGKKLCATIEKQIYFL